jgi:DHA1 family bicyclomycin/chloramphenicol resistance-like MFS transporter/DHA1 family 2-module integral membrane pump EmrD-like MFS transporter
MAIYMVGLALSQLFYGPLSEAFGRKAPLLVGLSILLVGNLVSLFAADISTLIAGRLIQGCGAGACVVLWRSIFRDTFEGAELAKYGAYFSIFVTFVVPAAPAVGGHLQEYFGWRASFVFLALYSFVTILMVLFAFQETSKHHHIDKLKIKFILESYAHMLSHRIFVGYTLCTFLCAGAFFSWFSIGPVVLIHIAGLSPVQFGWITLFGGGIATALSSWVNGRFVTKLGTDTMLRIGFSIMCAAGIFMLIGQLLFGVHVPLIVAPVILFYFGVTFIWPSAFAGAFGPFGKMAGYAGALYGCMQIGGAAVIGTLISYLPHQNQTALALIFIGTSLSAWLIVDRFILAKKEDPIK